ncbi:unnamed protein product [Agarophyton chilense]
MVSTVSTDYTTVRIEPHCIAQKAADLPRKPQENPVVYRFPWNLLAEAVVQVAILTLAAVVSIHTRLKGFVYLFCVLAVLQLILIVSRFQKVAKGAFGRDERFRKDSSMEWVPEASVDVSAKPNSLRSIIRKAISEELGLFRSELLCFEKLSIEREESRNLSISQALSSVNESVLTLKGDMERRDQLRPSVPYATLQELESLKTRISLFQRENASIKQQLRASQLNYEEVLRNAAKTRKETEDALFRELSTREELAIAQSRIIHLDELTDRLDHAETKNMELQEELLTRAREQERFKLSADDANRRVARVENIVNILREKLKKLSGNSPSGGQDEPVDDNLEDSEKRFWQKRLRSRGNLGRSSVVYQELLRGSKESLAKEWPSNPLGRKFSAKEEKNEAFEGLPADGGFASKDFKMLESAPNLEGARKVLGMSGVPSQGAFSFSRDEFEQSDRDTKNDTSRAENRINVNELFPEAEEVPDEFSTEVQDGLETPFEEKAEQSDSSEAQNTGIQTSKHTRTEKTNTEGERIQSLENGSFRAGTTSGSYMRWLEKASQQRSTPQSRTTSNLTPESNDRKPTDSSTSHFPSAGRPQSDEPIKVADQGTGGVIEPQPQDSSRTERATIHAGSVQETIQLAENGGDRSPLFGEVDFFEEALNKDVVKGSQTPQKNTQSSRGPSRSQDGTSASQDESQTSESNKTFSTARVSPASEKASFDTVAENMTDKSKEGNAIQDDVLRASKPTQTVDPGKVNVKRGGPNSVTRIVSSKIAEAQELIEKARSDGISISHASSLLEQARSVLEECLRLNCLRPEVEATVGECLVVWAKLDLKDQRAREFIREGLQYLSRSLEAQPNDEKALFNSALCNALYGALSTHEIAVRHQYVATQQFDKLLKLNPSAQVAAYNGGLAYLYLARSNIAYEGKDRGVIEKYFKLAIERFGKGVALNPQDPRNAAYLDTARNEMENFLGREENTTLG